jgi:hypothetical protein
MKYTRVVDQVESTVGDRVLADSALVHLDSVTDTL